MLRIDNLSLDGGSTSTVCVLMTEACKHVPAPENLRTCGGFESEPKPAKKSRTRKSEPVRAPVPGRLSRLRGETLLSYSLLN